MHVIISIKFGSNKPRIGASACFLRGIGISIKIDGFSNRKAVVFKKKKIKQLVCGSMKNKSCMKLFDFELERN